MRAWPRRWHSVVIFGMTVVCGTGLSGTVQVFQQFAPERVASLTDVVVNATGTTFGAVVGLLYEVMDRHAPCAWHSPGASRARTAWGYCLVVGVSSGALHPHD